MTKEKAIDYLIALACCVVPQLTCEECPLKACECKFDDKDIVEAVRVLNMEGKNEKILL